ncbi:MAG: GNAT family N-acetyltransferase [Pseudomonadota bacterium]
MIREELEEKKGRYVLEMEGHEAEMTFSIASESLRIVDHTGVPDALRGKGAGRLLAEHLVADARAKGFKIVPLCPFVNAERRKHPDWADVFSV